MFSEDIVGLSEGRGVFDLLTLLQYIIEIQHLQMVRGERRGCGEGRSEAEVEFWVHVLSSERRFLVGGDQTTDATPLQHCRSNI